MLRKITAILLLLIINYLPLQAQNTTDFNPDWKKIADLEKQGLTKSAISIAEKIFSKAMQTGNEPQMIKSAMYQMKYRNLVEEDNQENNIFFLDTLIAKSKTPARNILLSMQAEMFAVYKQNNRYKLYSRTGILNENSTDITTWSITKLNSTIAEKYKSSLSSDGVLKNTSLKNYSDILEKNSNARELRPTLYDLLAFRALDYFTSASNDEVNPSYKFILNDPTLFAPAKTFVQEKFITRDTSSLYHSAIVLMQQLLRFHSQDANPAAFIDADIQRLRFVFNNGSFDNKSQLYEAALKSIEAVYPGTQAIAGVMFERAALYNQLGEGYNPVTNINVKAYKKKAKELSDSIIRFYPDSKAAASAFNLVTQIIQPTLNLTTEKVNSTGLPFKSLVKFRNINTLYFRVIKTSREELKGLDKMGYDKMWPLLVKQKSIQTWSNAVPETGDYQEHSAEIKTDGLSSGLYILLVSKKADFSLTDNVIARQITYVSNISYINGEKEIYVLDRETGEPLVKAEVQLWESVYNSSRREYDDVKTERTFTDMNGYTKVSNKPNSYNNNIQIKYKSDELFTDDNFYTYSYNSYQKTADKKTFFFTDRSIYRPGQTLFFKGIMISTDTSGRKSTVVQNMSTSVNLYDANNQKVSGLKFTTNEFGSYNGNFKLPENSLNGSFYIKDSITGSSQSFNVEDYKRPKFYVEIQKPSGSYRLNDSITVTGHVKAYAGNSVDGAQVKYRVVRKIQYPVWFGWGRKIYPPMSREQTEITNGQVVTNDNGDFSIIFKAIPDETADKKNQPVFYYEVSADVTDLNGETRSGSSQVAVAYQAVQLAINIADNLSKDSLKTVRVNSTNSNGIFEQSLVRLRIIQLEQPAHPYRARYWEVPDQFIITPAEYKKYFPNDAYADEDQVNKWKQLSTLTDITDTTAESGYFKLPVINPAPGWYKIIAETTDKYGETSTAEKFVYLTGKDEGIKDQPLLVNRSEEPRLPGDKINYGYATGFDKIFIVEKIKRNSNKVSTNYIRVGSANIYNNQLIVTEADRGDVITNYVFVKNNRFYTGTERYKVPWSNKELDIQYETFRDKILPGASETFKIKISGQKSAKVASETLISMYDASLDQFKTHQWTSLNALWPVLQELTLWTSNNFTFINSQENYSLLRKYQDEQPVIYDELLNSGWKEYYRYRTVVRGVSTEMMAAPEMSRSQSDVVVVGYGASKKAGNDKKVQIAEADSQDVKMPAAQNSSIRKNFNETAFFFPALETDADGNASFTFTIPEALTTWKLMTLAHTKDAASAYAERSVITQKPLMIQPNAPRFLREGDEIEFSAKIVNMSSQEITGTAQLELFDLVTNKPVDGWFKNIFPNQYFTIEPGKSTAVKFPIGIPVNFNSVLQYRIKAGSKDGSFSDGEEAALPVLVNRTLVTETFPLNMRAVNTKSFKFDKLLQSLNSGSLSNKSLTLEYTSNPAWYAVQALPYLMEYPYECAEQNFNRYYSNVLASFISNSTPRIKTVFEQWLNSDTAALMSNLQKNEELKSALLEETPWVLEAKNEQQQKKNIALLFDMVRLAKEKASTLQKLKDMQLDNGGFSWFKGGKDDRYMTQYIITGIGHLKKLNALSNEDLAGLKPIIEKSLQYVDARIKEDYDRLLKNKADLKANQLSPIAIQYLYMRSFFPANKIGNSATRATDFYQQQSKKFWLNNSKYQQAMIAITRNRSEDPATARAILISLRENAIYKEETGMYFKEFTQPGYYWYQAPVEGQAMMIEAFDEIVKDNTISDDLKTWLLKQKQTQNWKSTKATAEACYALLLGGSNWLSEEKSVVVELGNMTIKSTDEKTGAGTGYFKHVIAGDSVQQGMGNITVKVNSGNANPNKSSSWGAIYWQYFEDLDKITTSNGNLPNPLKLTRKLFVETNADKGPVLKEITDQYELKPGDKVKVRIEVKADRDLEYIHLKDMRAACMEPVNVISSYKYQGGLGYYESTRDASTNFFFSWMPRGTYIFEYGMFVTHAGNYSTGISTIQSMYAPEFASHTEGLRVTVENK